MLIAALVLAPVVSVIWIAFHPTENIWPHLAATVLPRYLATTAALMAGVAVLTAAVGTGAAWLVGMYDFPGRRLLSFALVFPLAIPAYVGAYALLDVLDYAGPCRRRCGRPSAGSRRRITGSPRRGRSGLRCWCCRRRCNPYVYILARAAFAEQSGATFEVARALGQGPWGLFRRVGLPLARPAIAAGVALALMETVADYGTVHHFGVQTLTTGIFTTWLDGGNAGGAAQIAGVILMLIFLLVALERISRRGARFHSAARAHRPVERHRLTGPRAWAATLACAGPVLAGFVLPVAVMLVHSAQAPQEWLAPGLGRALVNTLVVAGAAAVATVAAAVFLVYGMRLAGRGLARAILP